MSEDLIRNVCKTAKIGAEIIADYSRAIFFKHEHKSTLTPVIDFIDQTIFFPNNFFFGMYKNNERKLTYLSFQLKDNMILKWKKNTKNHLI